MNTKLFASLLLFVSLGTAAQERSAAMTDCSLPDVAHAWQVHGKALPTLTEALVSTSAGQPGESYRVALLPCADKQCHPGSRAGLFHIHIPADGRYRVAVSDMSVWLDVLSSPGKAEGVMCEHAGCAPIKKIVQFDLKAGPNWVQLSTRKELNEVQFLVMPVRDDEGLSPRNSL